MNCTSWEKQKWVSVLVKKTFITFHFILKPVKPHFKWLLYPKMKMLSLITHPHVVPNPWKLCSSSEHNLRKENYEKHRQNTPSAISGSIWILWSGVNVFVHKENKNNDFFRLLSISPHHRSAILWTQTAYALLCQPQHKDALLSFKSKCKYTYKMYPFVAADTEERMQFVFSG